MTFFNRSVESKLTFSRGEEQPHGVPWRINSLLLPLVTVGLTLVRWICGRLCLKDKRE